MRQTRSRRKKSNPSPSFILAEPLECRRMLSAIPDPQATPVDSAIPLVGSGDNSATPIGYSPTQIRTAYGINNISFDGITGDGTGQTIAIIVAYDNPDLVDTGSPGFATSDLHMFDQQFGLPDPPSFMKVDQNGGTSYPGQDPTGGWENEEALDVEWTHAIAPGANILVVEAASTNLSNLIEGAVQQATGTTGVSVVTMSFAVPEFMGETAYDSFLESPSDHGVTFIAASGDNGNQGGYPAYSPNVVSVGATTLTLSGNNYSSETGRNSSGGGISSFESKPDYQFAETQSTTARLSPDVAFDGDPNTGVSVYDSFNGGSVKPWFKVGGTSFSAPAWAGLIAIADQGRAHLQLGSLDGLTQTLPRLYSLPSSDFHDITTGSNGFNAKAGYDLVTGLGSPIANKLIPDLAGGATVSGTVFADSNGNGTQDSGETGLAGVTVFTDLYNSGTFEGADQEVTSAANGTYEFTDLPSGTVRIDAMAPSGFSVTTTANYTVTNTYGSGATAKNFGFKATNTPTQLGFANVPSTTMTGEVVSPAIVVDVEDSSGNKVLSDNSLVTLSLATGSSTLGGTLTATAVNGVATFSNVTLTLAGTDTLKATDGSLTAATSANITVEANTVAPAGSQLVFVQQPTNTTIGAVVTPPITVDVENSKGDVITSDGSAVTLAIGSGSGTLGGSLTVSAIDGVATFDDITVAEAGTFTLTVSDGSLTPVSSSPFVVTAVPSQLAFVQPPTTAVVGEVITPAVTVNVEDGSGNLVTTDNSAVTLAIASGTGTLGGTLTVNAVNGVATFSDLTVSSAGAFTVTASDGALTSATSDSFNITTPGTLVPTVLKSTLGSTLVSGSTQHAAVVINVANTAVKSATGKVTANVFAVGNGTSVLLGTLTQKRPLKAGKPFAITVPIKSIPSSLDGTYTLRIQMVDAAGLLQNITGATISAAPPFIALAESVTKSTLLPSVVGGAKTRAVVVVRITNNGNIATSGLTTTRIYLSPNSTVNAGELVNDLSRRLVIKPGGSALVTVPLLTIPATLSGTLNLIAQVTDQNAVRTSVNSGLQVSVGAPSVALTATFTAQTVAPIAPGRSASVTVTVQNTGNIDSTGTSTIVIGLSGVPGSTTLTRPVRIPAGKSVILHLKLLVPSTLAAGQYFPTLSFTQPLASTHVTSTTALTVT